MSLQPGDQKHHAFDQVNEEVPKEDTLQAGRRTDQPGTVPADVESRSHCGEHA